MGGQVSLCGLSSVSQGSSLTPNRGFIFLRPTKKWQQRLVARVSLVRREGPMLPPSAACRVLISCVREVGSARPPGRCLAQRALLRSRELTPTYVSLRQSHLGGSVITPEVITHPVEKLCNTPCGETVAQRPCWSEQVAPPPPASPDDED